LKVNEIALSANIRFLRESGVKKLINSIYEMGFAFPFRLTVSGPHEGEKKYHLVDGAHRWAAVQRLGNSEDEKIKTQFKDFIFKDCFLLPPLKRQQEMSIAYGNFKN
jgi:ParB-like chromosome segregation protein Spo0J